MSPEIFLSFFALNLVISIISIEESNCKNKRAIYTEEILESEFDYSPSIFSLCAVELIY